MTVLKHKRYLPLVLLLTLFVMTAAPSKILIPIVNAQEPRCLYYGAGGTSLPTPGPCTHPNDPNFRFLPDKCYRVNGHGANEMSCSEYEQIVDSGNINPEDEDPGNGGSGGKLEADCNERVLTRGSCKIVDHLLTFINVLSGLVGITAVIMLVVWGIQYTVSRDNPQMVASARLRILNTVLAVVFYLFIYAFLQWLVPGGIF